MLQEIDALEGNMTWELVPLPAGKKTIGSKWVYKIKYKANGEIDKYKARLVAKGGAKPPTTPLEANTILTTVEFDKLTGVANDPLIKEICNYQKFVGKLIYLTITRPDICFTVQILSQFMQQPKSYCVAEIVWLAGLLQDLGVPISKPIQLHCDSKATIQIAAILIFHERTKHIDIDCHFVQEKVKEGLIETKYIATQAELADLLT
uniref:Uncharacterized protein LOC104222514 n=1 Tax=Nicotiana sylvestris TaxID=4096 RepID=A0A1U7VW80_NICSY|nr:PREDICTED: uncharacterized protein LOC104222514 [Nicotiana sylvestris]